MIRINREKLIELYQMGAYKYEELYFTNCMENKKKMREHQNNIDKIRSGQLSKRELYKLAPIFEQVQIDVKHIKLI